MRIKLCVFLRNNVFKQTFIIELSTVPVSIRELFGRVEVVPVMVMHHGAWIGEEEYQQADDQQQQSAQRQLHIPDFLSGLLAAHPGRHVLHEMPHGLDTGHSENTEQLPRAFPDAGLCVDTLASLRSQREELGWDLGGWERDEMSASQGEGGRR